MANVLSTNRSVSWAWHNAANRGIFDHFEERIGDGFNDQRDRPFFHQRPLDRARVGRIDKDASYAVTRPELVHQRVGGAIAVLRSCNGCAGLYPARSRGQAYRCHAATGSQSEIFAGAFGHIMAFQLHHRVFERSHRGISVAPVHVEIGVASQGPVEMVAVRVDIADAGCDAASDGGGLNASVARGIAAGFPPVDGFAVD